MNPTDPDPAQVAAALALLEELAADRGLLAGIDAETRKRLRVAAAAIAYPDSRAERRLARSFRRREAAATRAADQAALRKTGIRAAREAALASFGPAPATIGGGVATVARPGGFPRNLAGGSASPATEPEARQAEPGVSWLAAPELNRPRACYVCKRPYTRVHHFYDALCPECGDLNLAKRAQSADLRGRVAVLTGGRVKIGYQAGLKLLRAGARVVVTTRFARDAAQRYAREPDFAEWGDRLDLYGLDLRHTPSVERLAAHLLSSLPRLDFVIHNACQTVRRPPAFYAHLLERERAPLEDLPPAQRRLVADYERLRARETILEPARLSQQTLLPEDHALPGAAMALFPAGQLDADRQQVDLRTMNSWRLRLHEVSTIELLEVQLVNAVAPFVLSARLKPLLVRDRTFDRHVVNVSAMEGQFDRGCKTENHPHTNMAKAALNMLTRTSAQDWARDGVYMNSVDTGWVTDEDPAAIAEKKGREQGAEFHPPLDAVDGAARILDPIFHGLNTGEHQWGAFLKDYRPVPW